MKRKKFIKRMMALGFERNEAAVYASGCSGQMSLTMMGVLVLTQPELREIVRAAMPDIMAGAEFRVYLGEPGLHESKSE
jgi:hypothetical protein